MAERVKRVPSPIEAWLAAVTPGLAGRETISRADGPLVSVALVIEELDEIWAKASVSSAVGQLYPRVELIAAAPQRGKVDAGAIRASLEDSGRGKLVSLDASPSVTALQRAALERARGEYVLFLAHGDRLAPTAILRAIELLERVDADVVYTDEDTVDEFDRHGEVLAKPYWCPDLATSARYPGDMRLVRRELLAGSAEEPISEARIAHLPECLYHRMAGLRPAPAAAFGSGSPAPAADPARVSAIVLPPEGAGSPLEAQLRAAGVGQATFLADASGGEAVSRSIAANANAAARRATGELLLFVDGRADLGASTPDWLGELAGLADRDGIGAAGGEVRDADGQVLQAGLRPGLGPLAGPWWTPSVDAPLAGQVCNPLAVCAAPYVIRRAVFESLGGFDAERLPSSLFDADLTLRASRAGLRNTHSPSTAAVIPAAATATDEELAHLVRTWSAELSVIGAYDGARAGAASEATTLLGPDRSTHRLGRSLTLSA